MSVYSAKTGISSILKTYSPAEREKAKNLLVRGVRFEIPSIELILQPENLIQYNKFLINLNENTIKDPDYIRIISEAHKSIYLFNSEHSHLVEALITQEWISRSELAIQKFSDFIVDLLVAHNEYVKLFINKSINLLIPNSNQLSEWTNGIPSKKIEQEINLVHNLLRRLLAVIPMTFELIAELLDKLFPYYKTPSNVIGGYVYNILKVAEYQSDLMIIVIEIIFKNLIYLDVNAPRAEIEECEEDIEDNDNEIDEIADEAIFETDNKRYNEPEKIMQHQFAETLDICMEIMFDFLNKFNNTENSKGPLYTENSIRTNNFYNTLLKTFEKIILPSHNTHHIQYLLFYICSFKRLFAEHFLTSLWSKVIDPNTSAPIRQTSTVYIASFLARAKFLPLRILKDYLIKMCEWTHQYIQRSDVIRSNISLKANLVFFSISQAIFYVIAFRSRDLTFSKENLLFLQSLQLSALVTCSFNPLRVTMPVIATAFSGVTRTYQLAYCHTILERNARRKLATVYANDQMTPEECLETFFPFDPYLLKRSSHRISPIYLQYQASEAEEIGQAANTSRRKRGDSEMLDSSDEIDDFISDKRFKSTINKHINEDHLSYDMQPLLDS